MGLVMGDFRVVQRMAQGATSETWRLESDARTMSAVGKRLGPRFRDDPTARAELDRERRVLDALAGRGAPRLLAAGQDGEGPFLVMEHVHMIAIGNRPLRDPDERSAFVTRIAASAFDALATVHEARDSTGPLSVIHGDVSPDNLLASDPPPGACLVDFGLATFRDSPSASSGSVRGTLRTLAPEVARGEPADARSDLFALGLTLLFAASGEHARPGEQASAVLVQAGEDPVLAYAERAARGLPPALRQALLAAVAFDPEARPPCVPEAWRRGSW